MSRGAYPATFEVDLDIVPVVECIENLGGRLRVRTSQRRQRLVGEDHSPAERVASAVALDDRHLVRRVALLHQQGEVEARRAASHADDAHSRITLGLDILDVK